MANFAFSSGSTLKALLEDPNLQVAPAYNSSKKLKEEKKEGNDNQFNLASAAFLGPSLWDKTYDNNDFNLEYMDLDEFLTENGVQNWTDPLALSPTIASASASPNPINLGTSHMVSPQPAPHAALPPSPPEIPRSELAAALQQITVPEPAPAVNKRDENPEAMGSSSPVALKVDFSISDQDIALATVPVSPPGWNDRGRVPVEFSVSESDLALATAEGEEDFDPRKRQFTDDELKPQPMIKKSKKIFVPSDAKDDKYWARRRKNNMAAKRSRDARRIKENQIAMRAAFLEKENGVLRSELESVRGENFRLKMALKKYEGES